MTDLEALRDWGCEVLGWHGHAAELRPVAGDASFRRYYRLRCNGRSAVLCDAPPDKEKNVEFVAIARLLAGGGVRVPEVHAADFARGWLCLEDFGDQLLLPVLGSDNVDRYYADAMDIMLRLARIDGGSAALPPYDGAHLQREMDLFPTWFRGELLGIAADAHADAVFAQLSELLVAQALAQPQIVVHRDFHARNLMLGADGELGVIDFQDAVLGPRTYDLVSLLRDCYVRWPDQRVRHWALAYRDRLHAAGMAVSARDADFLRDFDFMGLQRHLKVLGIFSRLWLRDGKDGYLRDLPRVIGYTRDVLALYPDEAACADFLAWFDAVVMPRARAQPWYATP